MLSQSEIDALLKGGDSNSKQEDVLLPEEIDTIGEISNISMGTAATSLYTLISRKVTITTPDVEITTLNEVAKAYPVPFVAVEVAYTEGLRGTNLLIINEIDVKIITDLMMGGDGTNTSDELSELHLSAISEAMNQMIGSSCTSLSSMFKKNMNISPPMAYRLTSANEIKNSSFLVHEPIVKIRFKLEVAGLINSYIMQFLPIDFAKEMIGELLNQHAEEKIKYEEPPAVVEQSPVSARQPEKSISYDENRSQVNVHPVAFREFEEKDSLINKKENIDLILDVPLQISVELGKVKKLIREILELNLGSIIELDKMAGEPVDILVNGKMIAKGEVVVIDDSFGVRITDILSPEKRVLNFGK